MTILKEEGLQALKAGREWPDFSAGDAIEIHKLPYMSATVPDVIKGVVIGRFNKHMRMDASLLLLNVSNILFSCAKYLPLTHQFDVL